MKNENKNRKREDRGREADANRDPITGAPGSHPIGTGAGAAAGGLAGAGAGAAIGAAAGTAGAGPIGTGIGAVVGAIAGGVGGHAMAEHFNPTEEDTYWRDKHSTEPYYRSDYRWEDYQGAYRCGYEGYGRLGRSHERFDDAEQELRRNYEKNYPNSRLTWENARPAARAAWERVSTRSREGRHLEQLIDREVYDVNDNKVGTLKCIWSDQQGEPEFVGVNTGWLFGKTHVVPAQSIQVGERSRRIRLPYTEQKIKDAPSYDAGAELTEQIEGETWNYYGVNPGGRRPQQRDLSMQRPEKSQRRMQSQRQGTVGKEEAEIALSEEKLKVGKREVEAGGVRLRKIVRTEVVNQPIELKREEIVVERVPASEARQAQTGAFQEEEVYIPLRREEAVVQKEQQVKEVVRARKSSQSDRQEITEQVRSEEVEIESTGEAQETRGGTGQERDRRTPAEEIADREKTPRSRRNP